MQDEKLTSEHKPKEQTNKSFAKRNSLLENNRLAKWSNDVLIKKLDEFAYVRSMIGLVFLSYFLGKDLSIFISLYIGITIYLLGYRVIRFWVKRWLLYFIEFCYYGNLFLIAYLLYFPDSQIGWSITYMCSTGVLTWAVLLFGNQAKMDDSDHLTTCWIHSFPLITVWAIRWKHLLFNGVLFEHLKYNLIHFEDLDYETDVNFKYLIICPILFWCCWCIYYSIMSFCFKSYINSEKYAGGLTDFQNGLMSACPKLYGDKSNHPILKYLLQHFLFLLITMPLSLFCYYHFIFNTLFLVGIITFMAWNAGRKNLRYMQKILKKIEDKVNNES